MNSAPWRLSVSEWVLGTTEISRAIEAAAAAGLNGIELTARSTFDLAAARHMLDDCGLSVSGISPGYSLDRDFGHESPTKRARAVTHLRRCIDLACELSAPVVVVVPSDSAEPVSPAARPSALMRAADAIRSAVADLASDGPRIAIEPLNRYETYLVRTLAEADELRGLIGLPSVGIMADTFHLNIEEDNTTAALASYGHRLVHVDIADNQRREPGSGQFDFGSFLDALSGVGYSGWLNMECVPADSKLLKAGKRHIETIGCDPVSRQRQGHQTLENHACT
jgi:D-psicose/D-tagatose/L-ribulose 3-epimerase